MKRFGGKNWVGVGAAASALEISESRLRRIVDQVCSAEREIGVDPNSLFVDPLSSRRYISESGLEDLAAALGRDADLFAEHLRQMEELAGPGREMLSEHPCPPRASRQRRSNSRSARTR